MRWERRSRRASRKKDTEPVLEGKAGKSPRREAGQCQEVAGVSAPLLTSRRTIRHSGCFQQVTSPNSLHGGVTATSPERARTCANTHTHGHTDTHGSLPPECSVTWGKLLTLSEASVSSAHRDPVPPARHPAAAEKTHPPLPRTSSSAQSLIKRRPSLPRTCASGGRGTLRNTWHPEASR